MFLNVVIFVVVGYLVYQLVIRRIRWRIVRFGLYIPILIVVAFSIGFGQLLADSRSVPTNNEIASQIVDSEEVIEGNLVVAVSATGALQPIRQVPLTFLTAGKVTSINFEAGDTVKTGELIATADTSNLQSLVDSARIALDLQKSALDALTEPARDVDIAVAQSALDAAQAQYYAAASTGPTAQQEEISRLQFELAKNRNYQLNLQRDAIVIPDVNALDSNLAVIPYLDEADFPAVGSGTILTINQQITLLNDQLSQGVDALTKQTLEQQIVQLEAQKEALNDSLDEASTSASIAEANYLGTVNRSADAGSIASANLALVQAQISLDRLINGASDLELQQANNAVALAENALAQAEESLANGLLTAPFEGVIAQNNLKIGELPPQGIAVLLMDMSQIVVDLPIDETDIVKIQVGQRVEFEVDALPDMILTGKVTRIAYTPVNIGQLVTYTVRVELDPTDAPIRISMSVTGKIIVQEQPDVLIVRNRFIRIDPITQNAFVTIQNEDGSFQEVLVILGERNDTESAILGGLEPRQTVVLLPRGTEGVQGFFN